MSPFLSMPARAFACACVLASSAAAAAMPVALELRQNALIDRPRIVLADVADFRADEATQRALGSVDLGSAPRVGYAERLDRAQLEQAIRRAGVVLSTPEWSGAHSVVVRIKSQTVSANALSDAALKSVHLQFAAAYPGMELAVGATPAQVDVPLGPVELRVRPIAGAILPARVPVWVDLAVNGAVYRSVVVQLAASILQPAYVAVRALAKGDVAGRADFEVEVVDVAGVAFVPVSQPVSQLRMRQAVKAGQILSSTAVAPSGRVMRGDQVKLAVKAGQIGIEAIAIAMADAGPGQLIAVRRSGSSDVVTGRLSHNGTVEIE